jgi:hypothetical protein
MKDWLKDALQLRAKGKSIEEIRIALNKEYKAVQQAFYRHDHPKTKAIVEGKEEVKPAAKDMGDYYIVTSGKRNIDITKTKLKQLKELYCMNKLTVNTVCRKIDIPTRDFNLIKTAFNITHDDVPYLDEELEDIDNLVEQTIEKKKELYFLKLQEEEIKQLRKEVNKYREKDYYINRMHSLVTEHLQEFEENYDGPKVALLPKSNSGKMLEISIVDLHLGKLTWEPETGQNYDMKIASKKFMNVIYDIVDRTKDMNLEKIILPIGNDFFNFDNIEGKTTQGTPQDNDSRIHKMYGTGTELLIRTIDILEKIAPVEAFLVPGNHDMLISYYAADKIKTHFRLSPNVTINEQPTTRKYIEFGKCLIGFTHGDKEGKRIFGNMQQEKPEAWGRTKYREWHLAHLHSEQVKEEFGIKVRSLTSITGTDAWHYQKGYVGSLPVSQSFIWDKEKGLRDVIYTTVGY